MTIVSIIQPNYIPWLGYFDIINRSDIFVYYDTVQYTKNDWRNRNRIKTPNGIHWLTIPVQSGPLSKAIFETNIASMNWTKKHCLAFQHNYRKADFYHEVFRMLSPLYLNKNYSKLSDAVISINNVILSYLQIKTKVLKASEILVNPEAGRYSSKTERIVNICRQLGATSYLSGPSASQYLDKAQFSAQNIQLNYINYSGYSDYKQLWGEWSPGLSIVDLLFNCGTSSSRYLTYGK